MQGKAADPYVAKEDIDRQTDRHTDSLLENCRKAAFPLNNPSIQP